MRRADLVMAQHIREGTLGLECYQQVTSLLDEIECQPGAAAWGPGLAHARFTAAHVYQRPCDELEATLETMLAEVDDLATCLYATAAAYMAHDDLGPYFEKQVTAVQELPGSDLRAELLEYIERVRANVRRK